MQMNLGRKLLYSVRSNQELYTGIADLLVVYTILSPVMMNIIRSYLKTQLGFIVKAAVLIGPGLVAFGIYLISFGIPVIKGNKQILIALFSLSIIILFSSSMAVEVETTVDSSNHFFSDCLFGFLLGMSSRISITRAKRLQKYWMPFAMLFIGYCAYIFYNIGRLDALIDLTGNTFESSARVSALLFFFVFWIVGFWRSSKTAYIKNILVIMIFLCIVFGINAGSRSAFIIFVTFFIPYIIFQNKFPHHTFKHKLKNKLFFAIASISTILIVCFILVNSTKTNIKNIIRPLKQIPIYLITKDLNAYKVVNRLPVWKNAFIKFKQNPFWGVGYRATYYHEVYKEYRSHPHNIFLQFLAETGLLGLGVFAFFLVMVTVKAVKKNFCFENAEDKLIYLLFPLSFLYFLLFASFHFAIHENYFLWYFAGMIVGFETQKSLFNCNI